jgi:flagellar hook-basal body complex protein FliE
MLAPLANIDTLKLATSDVGGLVAANTVGPDFASYLKERLVENSDVLKAAESAASRGIRGEMSEADVVQSILAAQRSLQQMIGIRDRFVASLQEITRMAI